MSGASARLFLALWPSPRVREALAARRDRICWPPGAAPVPDARLHLTLHFLGSVPAARVPEIAAALPPSGPAFELQFGAPRAWHGGLVVLPPLAVPSALTALHAALGERLLALGLPVEARTFRPHVTLARRAPGALRAAARPEPPLRWRAEGTVLVQSLPDGHYRILARAHRDTRATQRPAPDAATPPAPPAVPRPTRSHAARR